jgi:hypothetical protein
MLLRKRRLAASIQRYVPLRQCVGKGLNISPETVMRDWKTAKAWLFRELSR